MTKDVLICIQGLQVIKADRDVVEVITSGTYHKRNGKQYIRFDEIGDRPGDVTKNMIKISPNSVEVRKSGYLNSQLLFEEGKKNTSIYFTPVGQIEIGIRAEKITYEEEDKRIFLLMEYRLEMNNQHVSDSRIQVEVTARE